MAGAEGLHTIAQGAWNYWDGLIRKYTDAPDHLGLLCGMGLGYEVAEDPVNQFKTIRPPLEEYADFKW